MGQKIIMWSTDNLTYSGSTSDISRYWQIILFGAFTHSKGSQLQRPLFFFFFAYVALHPEGFYPRIHQYGEFLWFVVLCRTPSSSDKRQHSGFAGGEWWCRREGGRRACGVLFWRGNKIEGSGNISWDFTQSHLESFLQFCPNCS